MAAPVTPPAPVATVNVSAKAVAADVVKYGGLAVSVLEVVENAIPGVGVPGGAQAVVAAIVAVLTALLAASKQVAVAEAKANVAKVVR